MFPRRSLILRYVSVVSVMVVISWMWISAPSQGTVLEQGQGLAAPKRSLSGAGDSHVPISGTGKIKPLTQPVPQPTRFNTLIKSSVLPRLESGSLANNTKIQSHHHNNDTLENLRKNMTLLRVDMKGIMKIMDKMDADSVVDNVNSQNVAHPHPFKYVINSPNICKDKEVFVIIYIHTAPDHYKRRMIIRQTWGYPKTYGVPVRLVFVMGVQPEKAQVQQALYFEAEQYGDIVQEDFHDTYRNLTYKGVAALKWISNFCSHSKYVLKTDDDIFVNMFTLLRHLESIERIGMENQGLLMCLVWNRMKVMRQGKWKVDESEYKDDYYPTYCSGSAFTMSTDVAVAMHKISYDVPFFWVDDFYITGLLPKKLGNIKHKQFMSTYVLDGRKLQEKFTGPQWFTYIFSHVHDLNAIQSVWTRLVKLANGLEKPEVKYAMPGQLPKEDLKPNKE